MTASPPTPGPSSINVFRIPHSRMKELVDAHLRRVDRIGEFTSAESASALDALLQAVYEAMWELKSHEYIENHFIMDKLKARLQKKQVYNQLVCNCHEDSKLMNVIRLVERVYSASSQARKEELGSELQQAISNFLGEFLNHMEQEEQVFQPLLDENFEAKELADMNEMVLKQHTLFREKVKSEKSLQAMKRKRPDDIFDKTVDVDISDLRFRKSYCQEVNDHLKKQKTDEDNDGCAAEVRPQTVTIAHLPHEVMESVFEYLTPRELLKAAAVSSVWYKLAVQPKFWHRILPTQWCRGDWSFANHSLELSAPDSKSSSESLDSVGSDEKQQGSGALFTDTAMRDHWVLQGIIEHLLPKVGEGVSELILSQHRGLTNSQINITLKLCPNVRVLDLSYTRVSHRAFRGLHRMPSRPLRKLENITFEGCRFVDDRVLNHLCKCLGVSGKGVGDNRGSSLAKLILSGCPEVTSYGIELLTDHRSSLAEIDLSGCYKVDGETLSLFVQGCSKLRPQMLAYCNDIEDGPYPKEANGCLNLDCSTRFCCQQFRQ